MVNVVQEETITARPVTPLGILVEQLQTVMRMVEENPDMLAKEVSNQLHSCLQLAAGIDTYTTQYTTPESDALRAINEATASEAWSKRFQTGETVRHLEQEMLSGHLEGQTLKMFVYMTSAKRILDIGMFTGYSALAMAEALPADGRLVACEVDPYVAEFAQNLFNASPDGNKISVELGGALETLNKLAEVGEYFDLVFIDADKKEYVQYYQTVLERNLLTPGGFICVDNTLLQGEVYMSEAKRSPNGAAIAHFNEVVAQDTRVEQVILPLRDGLTIIRRKNGNG